ncbi:DUF1488 family protein [Paraburkholderia sp.]|jgi:hypothetical protein|uniref:DUF1488 family protein n=1 Tax=Paraburkholderia sp. TaxID=1926495 RepID=UPI002F42D5AA
MHITNGKPGFFADGELVTFALMTHGRDVECAVTRDALERHFWLQRDADASRVAKAFEDGCSRILAVAERKALALGSPRVLVTAADFMLPRS